MSRDLNFNNFRLELKKSNPPLIPYLGVYLTDLTFIAEGNPDFLPGGLINFNKRRLGAEVILEIQQYQTGLYCLEEVPKIQEYLRNNPILDEDELYKISLQIEPRDGSIPKPIAEKSAKVCTLLHFTSARSAFERNRPSYSYNVQFMFKDAERQFQAAANLNPGNAPAWLALLRFYERHPELGSAARRVCARLGRSRLPEDTYTEMCDMLSRRGE